MVEPKEEMQRLLEDAQKITGVKYDITKLKRCIPSNSCYTRRELGITGTTAKRSRRKNN